MDTIKDRFLKDRVLTATPAQRVVMLYDRLALDLARARLGEDGTAGHLDHANEIVAELLGSLDSAAGGPTENLGDIYGYLMREILQARLADTPQQLALAESMVRTLRDAWAVIAERSAAPAAAPLSGMSWTA